MTNLETLQNVFKNRAFVIPDYQRAYAWETDQRQDLLNDLEDLEQVESNKMHFTGTLVLHVGSHSSQTIRGQRYEIADIVDGQQRITTLVILISCIVKMLRGFGSDPIAQETAQALYEEYVHRVSVQNSLYRLALNGGADLFFRDYVIGEATHPDTTLPAHANLLAATKEFQQYLEERCVTLDDDAMRVGSLTAFVEHITNRLGFVVYEVDNEAEVGVMFEVMNARGRPLTQLEKVKNFLLYLGARVSQGSALSSLAGEVNDTWKKLLEAILSAGSQGGEDQFLRYHWAIYPHAEWYEDGKRARTFDIHRAVKETLSLRHGKSPENLYNGIRGYLSSLRALSISYRDILNPRHPNAFGCISSGRDGLVERALTLRRIGRTATILPILMAAHDRFGEDVPELIEVFRLAEVFVFRLAAVEKNANTGDSYAYSLAAEIMAGALSVDQTKSRMADLIFYYCTDTQLRNALADRERNFYDWSIIKFFLYEYERHLVTEAHQKFTVDWQQFFKTTKDDTIEHILPQGNNTLQVSYWAMRFTPEHFAACRNRLGNLCLTDWNSYYSNYNGPINQDSKMG